jgi:hypothetical protein
VRFPFKQLPGPLGADLTSRPVVPVYVEGIDVAAQACLVDTGSLRNRFDAALAAIAGIELEDAEPETVALGGMHASARWARVSLRLGDVTWEAPVWFCDPWPFAFQLLGQEGFARYFRLTLSAAQAWIECAPEPLEPSP